MFGRFPNGFLELAEFHRQAGRESTKIGMRGDQVVERDVRTGSSRVLAREPPGWSG